MSDAEYGLVMPFVVCASNGGPYEDDSFVAGFALGLLDQKLSGMVEVARIAQAHGQDLVGRVQQHEVTVRTASLPQVDLIAMRYGLAVTVGAGDEEWTFVQLHRTL